MNINSNFTFSVKTIVIALILSAAVCLALPCAAAVAYVSLMLSSFIVHYSRIVPEYCFLGPINFAVTSCINVFFYLLNRIGCWVFFVACFLWGVIQGLVSSFFEYLSNFSERTGRAFSIFHVILGCWLLSGLLLLIFWLTDFSNDDAILYSNALESYAVNSWNALIDIFWMYKVYIFAWIPIALAVLPAIIKVSAIFLYRFFKIVLTGLYISYQAILLGIAIVIDWIICKTRIRRICPNEDCGFIGNSSVYQCPHCGELLTDLKPSKEGIFYTQCPSCRNKVSVSCLTGRNKYVTFCPKCHNTWEYFNFGKIHSSVFIVEGASKSGKTSFLVEMLIQWNAQFPDCVRFLIDSQKNNVKRLDDRIKEKRYCPPTSKRLHPSAYVMHYKKGFRSILTYFYDTGGGSSRNLQAADVAEPYFNLANGIFLLIDPWEKDFKEEADAAISGLCTKLEYIFTSFMNTGFKVPICVVVTKCDIKGLNKRLGVKNSFSQSSNDWSERSKQVENFLIEKEMYNFVNIVKTRFRKSAFFAVSVLDDYGVASTSVLNPLLWMIKNAK